MAAVAVSCLATLGACSIVQATRDLLADSFDAVGWSRDGQLVAATGDVSQAARLWTINEKGSANEVPFDACQPAYFLSLFPMPTDGQVGVAVRCADPPTYRIEEIDLATGRSRHLLDLPSHIPGSFFITEAIWLDAARTGYATYSVNGCYGVGEISDAGLTRLPLLPAPNEWDCVAEMVAMSPAASPSNNLLALFVQACPGGCRANMNAEGRWRIVVHDRETGRGDASEPRFGIPLGAALSDTGDLAFSAESRAERGIWLCPARGGCTSPRLVRRGSFTSLAFSPDGKRLAAIEIGATFRVVDVERFRRTPGPCRNRFSADAGSRTRPRCPGPGGF